MLLQSPFSWQRLLHGMRTAAFLALPALIAVGCSGGGGGGGGAPVLAGPTGLQAGPRDQGAELRWDPYAGQGVLGYRLERSTSATGSFQALGFIGGETFIDAGVENLTPYFYRVRAETNEGVLSNWSEVATVIPHDPGAPGDTVPPNPPVEITYEVEATSRGLAVVLSWAPNIESDLNEYRVYRADGPVGPFSQVGDATSSNAVDLPKALFEDGTVLNGASYAYQLRALDSQGNLSDPSDMTEVQLDGFRPPSPPQGLSASTADGVVSLSWEANSEPDLAGYRVYRMELDAPEVQFEMELTNTSQTSTTFDDSSIQLDRRYKYAVRAQNDLGQLSRWSEPVLIQIGGPIQGQIALRAGNYQAAVGHFDIALASLSAGTAEHTEVAIARCRARAYLDSTLAREDFMQLAGATDLEEKAYRDMIRDLFNGGANGLLEAVNVVDAGLEKFPESEKLQSYLEKLIAEAAKAEGAALYNALMGLGY